MPELPTEDEQRVAPLVGAWIEIVLNIKHFKLYLSLLSWERGLKYAKFIIANEHSTSLLSWERGLKYSM